MSVLESGIMETVAAADSNISSQAPAFLPETTHAPYCSIFSTMQPYSEVYGAATSSSFPIYQPIPPTNYASDCTAYTSMSQTNCLQSYPAYMPSCPDYIPFCTDHSNTYAFPNMECSNFKPQLQRFGGWPPKKSDRRESWKRSDIMEIVKHQGNQSTKLSPAAVKYKRYIDCHSALDESERVTPANYFQHMKLMVDLEDCQENIILDDLSQNNVQIAREGGRYYVKIKDRAALESIDSAFNDRRLSKLLITPFIPVRKLGSDQSAGLKINGEIVRISDGNLYFDPDGPLKLKENHRFSIRFEHKRTTFVAKHAALEVVRRENILNFLFPMRPYMNSPLQSNDFQCIGDPLNDEQKLAVVNSIAELVAPFLIFGPPGTGKTKTMTEAIAQITSISRSNQKVLVCASSNSVCDEIRDRLLKLKPFASTLRLLSKKNSTMRNYPEDHDSPDENVSSFDVGKIDKNSREWSMLLDRQVIICTPFIAGRLAEKRIAPNHFSYIFIDECASISEPEALSAIVVAANAGRVLARVVLLGDPLQLRGVVHSKMAENMGYGISLMERLMNLPPYKKHSTANGFNNRYVVQLTSNYRSHSAILQPSNVLFYENTLKAVADPDTTNKYIGTALLPSSNFPVIFKSVQGECHRNGSSLYNDEESDIVLSYVRQLLDGKIKGLSSKNSRIIQYSKQRKYNEATFTLPRVDLSEIGLISPYKSQCRRLQSACKRRNWDNIKIGSLEIFQGQERPIIIVSMVRSQMDSIGFLDNFRRLNVLLTRAKCLMIIVGDPFTLSLDKNWCFVLNYILENKGFIQSDRTYSKED